jgi:hypothetical protein
MPTNKQRVMALEKKARAVGWNRRVIIAKVGETAEQARKREGVGPDESVVIVTFVSPRCENR